MAHPEIIPHAGVLGGRMGFYSPRNIHVLNARTVYARFDDGHIMGSGVFEFTIEPDGRIDWRVLDSAVEDVTTKRVLSWGDVQRWEFRATLDTPAPDPLCSRSLRSTPMPPLRAVFQSTNPRPKTSRAGLGTCLVLGAAVLSAPQAMGGGKPPVLPGWPQQMGTDAIFAPAGVSLADLEGDGPLEVIAGSTDNLLYVWDVGGNLLPGWPRAMGGMVQSKVAVADLDQDGDLELAVALRSGQLYVLHHDGTVFSGWPRAWGSTFPFNSPTIYDLDGDEQPEVLIAGGNTASAWRADGTPMPGWPVTLSGQMPATVTGTLAVANVIGDARPEVFVVTLGTLYGLAHDGTALPGWPQAFLLDTSFAAPSIGDLDGDGGREILAVAYSTIALTARVLAYRSDGTPYPNFPRNYFAADSYSCPVLGDVDQDGKLEIFNAGKTGGASFYAWNSLGAVLPGWPVAPDPNMDASAIIADFDGDSGIEVAIADNFGRLHGYEVDGAVAHPPFPVSMFGWSGPQSPSIADVDLDGDMDVAMTGGTGFVGVWDFGVPYDPARVEWGTLYHDNWHTNQYGFVIPAGTTGVGSASVAGASALRLAPPAPNPFRSGTTIGFRLGGAAAIRLTVVDVAGREIRRLAAGNYGEGEHALWWDGLNAAGKAVASGIYLVHLEAPSGAAPREVQRAVVLR